jgi:hypothetical protein
MRGKPVVRLLSSVVLLSILVLSVPGMAQEAAPSIPAGVDAITYDIPKVAPSSFSGDVRNLPQVRASSSWDRPVLSAPGPSVQKQLLSTDIPDGQTPSSVNGPLAAMPGPTQSFAGMSRTDLCTGGQCGAGWPPDTNGDVGQNHYILAVNDAYAIYNKTGTLLASFTENSLFSGGPTGTICDTGSFGDPIVLFDRVAHRWILSNFAFALSGSNPVSPFYQCIAASKSSDPVAGGWWLYAVRMDPGGAGLPPVGTFNDYSKFGLWSDCLYFSANGFLMPAGTFNGAEFGSFSRSDLYSGAAPLTGALGFIANTTDPFTMIPSNLLATRTNQLPPTGTPNYFVSESQTAYAFEVRKFTPGTNCGGGGTMSAATNVSQTSYTSQSGAYVPQPGTTNKLDVISDRLMQKVQYRNISGVESLWVTHNVRTSSAANANMAMQWAQLNVTGGTIATAPVQQGIHAPDSTLHRWMGSLAVDNQGNMALGYSTSNGTTPNYPSIAYAGRLASDTPGTLPQTETQLIAGAGSQINNCGGAACNRWGDYSAMSVDPVDDCTFWYTNQYYSSQANGAAGDWQTRIGSFKFPTCSVPNAVKLSGLSGGPAAARWPLALGGLMLVGLVGAAMIRRRLV